MELITNNPYRQLGLLVGATARQESNHKTKINQYLEAEQEIPNQYIEYGFECLGKIQRTNQSITNATSNLNLDADKMSVALFWFCKGNEITDEPAFDALKENDVQGAISIWKKLTSTGEVTLRNYSAFQNLSTLLLSKGYNERSMDPDLFKDSIKLKLKFLESDFFREFRTLATGITYNATKEELQLLFLNIVYTQIERTQDFGLDHFFRAISSEVFSAKEEYLNNFSQIIIAQIQKQIDEAKINRKANQVNGIKIGNQLAINISENLSKIKSIFGASNIKFSSISDKVSEEILQCGIDYFKYFRDKSKKDPINENIAQADKAAVDAIGILTKAIGFAVGNIVKQRCEENIEQLQDWIKEKPQRIIENKIENELKRMIEIFEVYEKKNASIDNALNLIEISTPILSNIKYQLGEKDEFYLKISTKVASEALSFVIDWVNRFQTFSIKQFNEAKTSQDRFLTQHVLKLEIEKANKVIDLIGVLDMEVNFRLNRYKPNKATILDIYRKLGSSGNSGSSSSSGCYIATMIYGDYDHPQVMILRHFRDNFLERNIFGRIFIKTYYRYSPKLVEKLKHRKVVNLFIRIILNSLIKIIQQ